MLLLPFVGSLIIQFSFSSDLSTLQMRFSLLSILALAPAALAVVVDTPKIKSRRTWDLTWRLDTPKIGFTITRDFINHDFLDVAVARKEAATFRIPRDVNLEPG